jgi:hypothetical protein
MHHQLSLVTLALPCRRRRANFKVVNLIKNNLKCNEYIPETRDAPLSLSLGTTAVLVAVVVVVATTAVV